MKIDNYEIRNRSRYWTDDISDAKECRGILYEDGATTGKDSIIYCDHLKLSEDGTRLYNYKESYELGNRTTAYQAWIDHKDDPDVTVVTSWWIDFRDGKYYVSGRLYKKFHIDVVTGPLDHAEGSLIVAKSGKKYLLDPKNAYWANPISTEDLPEHLRPNL